LRLTFSYHLFAYHLSNNNAHEIHTSHFTNLACFLEYILAHTAKHL